MYVREVQAVHNVREPTTSKPMLQMLMRLTLKVRQCLLAWLPSRVPAHVVNRCQLRHLVSSFWHVAVVQQGLIRPQVAIADAHLQQYNWRNQQYQSVGTASTSRMCNISSGLSALYHTAFLAFDTMY